MLFFHASGFHSDVAWLQAREEMATRQSLIGCCSHHEKTWNLKLLQEKNPALHLLSPWRVAGKGNDESLVLPLGSVRRLSLSSLERLQKAKPLTDSITFAINGVAAALGATIRKMCFSPPVHQKHNQELMKFHTKLKMKEFFLIRFYTSLNAD